ncbi:MAG: hypothetical protein ACRCST_05100 [Turicibacter sp.]
MKYKDKFTMISYVIIFLIYNMIAYVFDIDILKIFVINDKGSELSLVSLVAPLLSAYIIYFCTKHLNKHS